MIAGQGMSNRDIAPYSQQLQQGLTQRYVLLSDTSFSPPFIPTYTSEESGHLIADVHLNSNPSLHPLPPTCFTPPKHTHTQLYLKIGAVQEESSDTFTEHKPLEEGFEKHIISVFVADEAGLINRVAGVFARRSANIESLAVGLTVDKALFTIVANGTSGAIANLCKQLSKLINVRYVEDITTTPHIQRELVLIKVEAPAGPVRAEIMQICDIFRARVVDVSDRRLVLACTGDPGKIEALQLSLSKYEIIELVRTGRIALKRGKALFKGGGPNGYWGSIYPPPEDTNSNGSTAGKGASGGQQADTADTYEYTNEEYEAWHVQNVLDAAYEDKLNDVEPRTLCIEVEDVPGVLNQVTGVFARRGYNVQSLAVGNSEVEGMSRITMVAPGDSIHIGKLIKQLQKLVYVAKVTDLTITPHVLRELMLIKVTCLPEKRGELLNLAQIFRGAVCDISVGTLTMEVTGKEDKLRAVKDILAPYGILEVARTGRVALERDSGVDSKMLKGVALPRVML